MSGISNIGIRTGIGIGLSRQSWSSYWTTQANFYELWHITGAGTMVGLKRGDSLTITGSGLNAIYAVPDTAAYKTRDTDYVFHKSDGSVSTACDGNRLIGHDFPKIIVKYGDVSPYAIEYIGILDTGQSVNNKMRDDFHLSRWWDNTLSFHGVIKGNRTIGQSAWTAESVATSPTVTTTAITFITSLTATSGGNVTSEGGDSVTARGICWSTSANPTTVDSKTTNGTGVGVFASSITGLTANTVYHVRAYATNSEGTAYGADVQFTSSVYKIYDSFTDDDNTEIESHNMEVGEGWVEVHSVKHGIVGNEMVQLVADAATATMKCNIGSSEFDLTYIIKIPGTNYYYLVLGFRYQDETHKWIIHVGRDGAGGALNLLLDTVNKGSVVFSPTGGTSQTIRLVTSGNSIKVYWNGSLKFNISDATYNDKTFIAFNTYLLDAYVRLPVEIIYAT